MKKNITTYIVNPIVGEQLKKNPSVLRVIMNNDYTRIDFGYAAPWMYVKGGWIRIAPYTYLEHVETGKRFALKEAKNIPYAPERFDFESKTDWRVFSLYFEPLPIRDCTIHIIEEEEPESTDFNYYNIKLEHVQDIEYVEFN